MALTIPHIRKVKGKYIVQAGRREGDYVPTHLYKLARLYCSKMNRIGYTKPLKSA